MCFAGSKSMLTIVSTGSFSISGSKLGSVATTRGETSVVVMVSTSNLQ